MSIVENREYGEFSAMRSFDERTEDELRLSAQTIVLRELLMEEEVKRLMYITTPIEDEEAREHALNRLHEAEALSEMGKLVAGSDLRYTREPDPSDGVGMSYAIASFNQDRPEVLITSDTTRKLDVRKLRRDWQRTLDVSIGGQAMEEGEARVFARLALTVVERVKWKMEGLKPNNTVHIPAPRPGGK